MGAANRQLTQSDVDLITQEGHIAIAETVKEAYDTIEGWYAYMQQGHRRLRASAIDHLEYAADQCDEAGRLLRVLVARLRV